MSRLDDEKYDADHASLAGEPGLGKTDREDGIDRHLAITKPAILEGLSDEEIAVIDKSTTKKLDILLMPTLVTLYIVSDSHRHRRCADFRCSLITSTGRTLLVPRSLVSTLISASLQSSTRPRWLFSLPDMWHYRFVKLGV